MSTIKISRIAHLTNVKAVEKFIKRAGHGSVCSRHDPLCVITAPMNDYDWELIRFWASDNGLLAN